MKAEQQSDFNAKYAAEQKSQAEMFSSALTISNAEKDMVKAQKSQLEIQLGTTQRLLSMEKAENAALTQDLAECNNVKNDLTIQLAVQTNRAENVEQELAETRARLEEVSTRAVFRTYCVSMQFIEVCFLLNGYENLLPKGNPKENKL